MKRSIPLLILLAIVLFFFRAFFLHGLLPIPSDTLVGLYNPYRDVLAKDFPRGVPFKNFLITDPIRQQYPWREFATSLEKQFQLPLWNPYSFSGYPLLANFQSAVFSPFNILFFILPFSIAWTMLIMLQPLLAGIFLYLYLRNRKIHTLAALLGAIVIAFSGFSVAWLEWGIIMQTLLWVPLILLAKDKLVERLSMKWATIFLLAEIFSFLGGHLQIWFYAICLTNAYLFLRIYIKTKREASGVFIMQYLKNYFPFFLIGAGMFMITAIQWIPTLQLVLLSARGVDQSYLQSGWFIPYQHLLQFLIPDFFGNPTTLNYWGVWNYGELVGFIGVVPLFFAFLAVCARRDKITYFFGGITIIALLFALPTPLAYAPFILHVPFLSTSQPTRLLGIIDVSLCILAALGLDIYIKTKKVSTVLFSLLGFFTLIFVALWIFVIRLYPANIAFSDLLTAERNMIFPTAVFASGAIILMLFSFFRKRIPSKVQIVIVAVLVLISTVDVLRFADKFTPFTQAAYLYPSTKAIQFLKDNIRDYRFMTTNSQILPPNVSVIYRLQSIEGYDPLYLQNYGAFIAAMLRGKPDISTPFGFNRIITPHDVSNPFINLLGVKYVVSLDTISQPFLKKVFEEGETKVYENKDVLPRTFFVKKTISVRTQQEAIGEIFHNQNSLSLIAIVNTLDAFGQLGVGSAQIISYSPNVVAIQTQNHTNGFLVLTDVYYPTWHAYIDGKQTKIYSTDFTFRGIAIPAGNHTITFRDQLL